MQRSKKPHHVHCPVCLAVMTPEGLEKHVKVTHDLVICDCGESMEPRDMQKHKKEVILHDMRGSEHNHQPIHALMCW